MKMMMKTTTVTATTIMMAVVVVVSLSRFKDKLFLIESKYALLTDVQ